LPHQGWSSRSFLLWKHTSVSPEEGKAKVEGKSRSMDMMVNARGEEKYGGHHNLGLSLSLGIATAAPVEPSPPPRQQRALSVAPVSSFPAPSHQQPQCWNGFGAGLFFSPSTGEPPLSSLYGHACRRMHDVLLISSNPRSWLRACRDGSVSGKEAAAAGGVPQPRDAVPARDRREPCAGGGEPARQLQRGRGARRVVAQQHAVQPQRQARRAGQERRRRRGPGRRPDPRAGGGGSDDEDSGAGGGSRKKLRLSKDQAAVLEESFKEHNTLNPKQKAALARQLNLKPRQVEVWFQNRRARTKLKQTEVDCEFLKRCCESLTEENRRLQREVAELRALKLVAPHHYTRMPPPTTLTMCPSCERVASAAGDEPARTAPRPAAPAGPWGPVPVRPVFVDGPARRS
ncbi:hypothetical protein EJB05_23376, partial [Eragrostis curvula]